MASSGSFSFGCSAAVPLLPTPSFSFPRQPAASSFPFTNNPAPTPCRHLPPHLVRFPRPLCLLGSTGAHPPGTGAKGKAPLSRTGADPEGTRALERASRGEALGRTGADPAGTGALGRASRGEAVGSTGAFLRSQFPFAVILRAHRPQHPVPGL